MENAEIKQTVLLKAAAAKEASRKLVVMTSAQKDNMLFAMADALSQNVKEILFHNEIDVQAAKETGMSEALIDRLTLNPARIDAVIRGVRDVIKLHDPVGTQVEELLSPLKDLDVKKVRAPLGVVAMIYEARPNVTVDAAVLCLKAGNAVIL